VESRPLQDYIEAGYIDVETKQFRIMGKSEIEELLAELEKEGRLKQEGRK